MPLLLITAPFLRTVRTLGKISRLTPCLCVELDRGTQCVLRSLLENLSSYHSTTWLYFGKAIRMIVASEKTVVCGVQEVTP